MPLALIDNRSIFAFSPQSASGGGGYQADHRRSWSSAEACPNCLTPIPLPWPYTTRMGSSYGVERSSQRWPLAPWMRMMLDHEAEHPSQWATIASIAGKVGCMAPTLSDGSEGRGQ